MSCELTIWTIGHSTRPLDEFLAMLGLHRIEAVADVRRFPGSRRCPQYGRVELQASLAHHHLGYRWLPALGGRRRPAPDSANIAWRNASFRGYADYMQTPEFAAGLDQLLGLSRRMRTTLMCAESMWWRCHRSMIADALRARGITVVHILDAEHSTVHPWTEPARIVNGRLTYVATDSIIPSH
ncbi:DUF488 domain-containing protein [Variovorax sp. RA8]|uniref:DUF488 domain-containing protein n=1 Tax=Variovorax sp. (strain JCM 16519 / RA8) TaxID=662548 RepID=UPI000A710074|nr:DUF488 domain-containing protein [Variovorax sp. RA8]VTU44880.1 hypothetical protein RA8P2_00316 [Variovorax sp. RA8]